MDEQELDRMLPGWRTLSDAVGRELIAWREAQPKASLRQIEDAVFEAMQRLQARALQQVVLASAVADVAAQPVAARPSCPTCGGRLEPRGRQRRTIRPARQRAALEVDRSYAVCAECGAGLFPSRGKSLAGRTGIRVVGLGRSTVLPGRSGRPPVAGGSDASSSGALASDAAGPVAAANRR